MVDALEEKVVSATTSDNLDASGGGGSTNS